MKISLILSFVLTASLVRSSSAAVEDDAAAAAEAEAAPPRELSKKRKEVVPVKGRPEGVTEGPGRGKNKILASEMVTGRVVEYNVRTLGNRVIVSHEQAGNNRQAWGLEKYKSVLFVASGGQSFGGGKEVRLYVYDFDTGDRVASCKPDSWTEGFINDVTVLDGVVYVTDTYQNRLMLVDAEKARRGKCEVSSMPLPPDFDVNAGTAEYAANGVVAYGKHHILVSHEQFGSVFAIDVRDGTYRKIIQDDLSTGPDGLAVKGNKLYVTQNIANNVAVYSLSKKIRRRGKIHIRAKLSGCLISNNFRTVATSAIVGNYVYSANSWLAQTDFDPSAPLPSDTDIESVVGVPLSQLTSC